MTLEKAATSDLVELTRCFVEASSRGDIDACMEEIGDNAASASRRRVVDETDVGFPRRRGAAESGEKWR